jgi:hypothetical protein
MYLTVKELKSILEKVPDYALVMIDDYEPVDIDGVEVIVGGNGTRVNFRLHSSQLYEQSKVLEWEGNRLELKERVTRG